MQQLELPIRNAALYSAMRAYVEAAFDLLRADVDAGAEIPFSVAAHQKVDERKPFYEYRPAIESFVEARLERISALKEADDSAWAIASDPACNSFLRAGRADVLHNLEDVATNEILVPLLYAMADASPSFELDESLLLVRYRRFEELLYTEQRRYAATAPLWGVRLTCGDIHLSNGVRIRQVDPDLFRREWMEAAQLDWGERARDGLPAIVLEFERSVGVDDNSGELDPMPAIVQVLAVIRALAGGAIHAGPLIFERLDVRPLAPRPVPALAARPCSQVPTKIDAAVAKSLAGALKRLSSDPNGSMAAALQRYQEAAGAPTAMSLRTIFDALVEIYASEYEPSAAALRMAVVVGGALPERRQFVEAMTTAANIIRRGKPADEETSRVIVVLAAALRATIAAALVGELPLTKLQTYADSVILGERDRRRLGVAAMRPVVDGARDDV